MDWSLSCLRMTLRILRMLRRVHTATCRFLHRTELEPCAVLTTSRLTPLSRPWPLTFRRRGGGSEGPSVDRDTGGDRRLFPAARYALLASWPSVVRGNWTRVVLFRCILGCLLFWFVLSLFICIFLYCFVCQYQSCDWLWRPPPKWPILCRVGR